MLLTAGEGRRAGLGLLSQADPVDQFLHDLVDPISIHAVGDLQRQRHVLLRREVVEQAEILEDHADPASQHGDIPCRHVLHVVTEHPHQAPAGTAAEMQQAQQRRLASTGTPGQKVKRTFRQLQIQVAQDFRPGAIAQSDIAHGDQRFAGSVCPLLLHVCLALPALNSFGPAVGTRAGVAALNGGSFSAYMA